MELCCIIIIISLIKSPIPVGLLMNVKQLGGGGKITHPLKSVTIIRMT